MVVASAQRTTTNKWPAVHICVRYLLKAINSYAGASVLPREGLLTRVHFRAFPD